MSIARRITTRLAALPNTWKHNRRVRILAADSAITLLLIVVTVLMYGPATTGNINGLLFDYSTVPQLMWSIVLALPFAGRRTFPQTAALSFAVIALLQVIIGPSILPVDFLALPMLYSVIVYGDPRNTKAFIVLSAAVGTLAGALMSWAFSAGPYFAPYITHDEFVSAGINPDTVQSCWLVYANGQFTGSCAQRLIQQAAIYIIAILACIVSVVIASFWQRARLITIRMMRERNDALQASEDEERHIAALAERARIARDMHDVVAHTLSIIIVQSDGGRYAGAHDPAVARHTMETIRHESERALHDMKRLFNVFGGSVHADWLDIAVLVEQAQAAAASLADGSVIDRRIEGTPQPQLLGGTASVAIYHLVQEALTNARKYAGPSVHVQITERWSANAVDIVVADNGRGASSSLDGHKPGYGLLGMRERIEAVNGTIDAGPQVGGGFIVHACVPLNTENVANPANPTNTAAPVAPNTSSATLTAASTAAPPAAPTAATSASAAVPPTTASVTASSSNPTFVSPAATFTPPTVITVSSVLPSSASSPTSSSTPSKASSTSPTSSPTPSSTSPSTSPEAPSTASSITPPAASSSIPNLPHIPTWTEVRDNVRSKPIAQAVLADGLPFNWIERLSQWTERHYLATDIIGTLLLISIMSNNSLSLFDGLIYNTALEQAINRFIVIITMLPLCLRRRFPEATAVAVAIASAFQLIVFQPILFANLFSLCALYSAVLYGRPQAWKWTGAVSASIAMLFGLKTLVISYGYASILHWILRTNDYNMSNEPTLLRQILQSVSWGGLIGIICMGTILLARWHRTSGANVLVLQAREEALRSEQNKQRILAANMERNRISANIQTEVSTTLTAVIDQAVAGIRMLDDAEAQGVTPSAESITSAFTAIGKQGRIALKHMRQLLSVLRETGFSDEQHNHQPQMQLHPVASLDEQLDTASTTQR